MDKNLLHKRRKARIRAGIVGNSSRPRLAVHRSNTALSAQVIDDTKKTTLISKTVKGTTIPAAASLGAEIAKACKAKKITHVVFDRGGYRYHGAVRSLADAVREGGVII